MKVYLTATQALIEHLKWLGENDRFNSVELAQKMRDAGLSENEVIGEAMFRMLRRGTMKRLVEDRAVAACRVLGIQVVIVNPTIPAGWKPKDDATITYRKK